MNTLFFKDALKEGTFDLEALQADTRARWSHFNLDTDNSFRPGVVVRTDEIVSLVPNSEMYLGEIPIAKMKSDNNLKGAQLEFYANHCDSNIRVGQFETLYHLAQHEPTFDKEMIDYTKEIVKIASEWFNTKMSTGYIRLIFGIDGSVFINRLNATVGKQGSHRYVAYTSSSFYDRYVYSPLKYSSQSRVRASVTAINSTEELAVFENLARNIHEKPVIMGDAIEADLIEYGVAFIACQSERSGTKGNIVFNTVKEIFVANELWEDAKEFITETFYNNPIAHRTFSMLSQIFQVRYFHYQLDEGEMSFDQLESGGIYSSRCVVAQPYAEPVDKSYQTFKFTKYAPIKVAARLCSDYDDLPVKVPTARGRITGRGLVCYDAKPLNHTNCQTLKFVKATSADKQIYRTMSDSTDREDERRSRMRYANFLTDRKRALNLKRKRLDANSDIRTQLMSATLHNSLKEASSWSGVAKSLMKLNRLGFEKDSIRNLTIRTSDSKMTYMPKGKDTEMSENGRWAAKGRTESKYGKGIRKFISSHLPKKKFNDQEIEKLTNYLKAYYGHGDFSVVKGDDILDWYDGETYSTSENLGTLGHSCMRYSSCRRFMEIYSENPKQVEMLILVKQDKLIGRALIWHADDGNTYMDRIYASDSVIVKFTTYAREKGWYCKQYQDSDCETDWISPDSGGSVDRHVTITLDKIEHDRYPYADTMYNISTSNSQVSNGYIDDNMGEMRDTSGSLSEDPNRTWDEYDDRYIDQDDAVYLESRGYETHYSNAVETIDGDMELREDCVQLCNCSTWVLVENTVEAHDGSIIAMDDATYCNGDDVYVEDEDDSYTCELDSMTYAEAVTPSANASDGKLVAYPNLEEYEESINVENN